MKIGIPKSYLFESLPWPSQTHKSFSESAHNSRQPRVSTASDERDSKLVKILEDAVSDQGEEDQDKHIPMIETNSNFPISLGDWVLVSYDGQEFPGEVTPTVGLDFEVIVMHKSDNAFWEWPSREDEIFYQRENVKKSEPTEVAGTREQFFGQL